MHHHTTRRCPDGSIDFNHYRRKAAALRVRAMRRLLRRTAACMVARVLAVASAFLYVWRRRLPVPERSKRRLQSDNVSSFG